ncbi:MAG: hypothetical protein IIY81_03270 [Lachnospiraceae bacterium]|nr:hypothetical protein [Lachnospiraceae bacterium]
MKVKDLIEELQKMPQDLGVFIELRQSENDLCINEVKQYEKLKCVCLVADWRDFKIDEEAVYFIEQELDEEARQDALDTQVDIYLGK